MRALALSAIVIAIATPASAAEHRGPSASFPGMSPEAVIAKLSAECVTRGFAVNTPSPTELVCQAGDLVGGGVFRAKGPPANPHDKPQLFHRFNAVTKDAGTEVSERSTMVMAIPTGSPKLNEMTPRLAMASNINRSISEFYLANGGVIVTP